MKDPIPEHLKPVRQILMDSAQGTPEDEAPPPSGDLLDDLEKSLTGHATSPAATSAAHPSLFERARRLFASPAFGLAAAVIVVLFVAVPLFQGRHGFRSGGSSTAETARVILVGIDDDTFATLSSNGLFDPQALLRLDSRAEADAMETPKVIVDFEEGMLRAYDAGGNDFYRHIIKAESSLPSDIAQALSKLPPSP